MNYVDNNKKINKLTIRKQNVQKCRSKIIKTIESYIWLNQMDLKQ